MNKVMQSVLISQGCCNQIPPIRYLKPQTLLSHSSGYSETQVKVSVGLIPFEAVRENVFQAPLIHSGCLLEIVGISWLAKVPSKFLPSSSHGSSHGILPHIFTLSLCPEVPFFSRHQSYWIRAQSKDFILTNYICNNSVSKEGCILRLWGWTSTYCVFWGEESGAQFTP